MQIIDAESYLPESIRSAELKIELERLFNAHNAITNNFYLEPPCARQVQRLVGRHGVPQQINSYFTMVITDAFLTNGNGKCWSADSIYVDLINNFTQAQYLLSISSFTHDKISSKLQFSICISQFKQLLRLAEQNVTAPSLLKYIKDIKNYSQPLYELKNDLKIIKQIEHLKKIVK